jgi:hypothetical protein
MLHELDEIDSNGIREESYGVLLERQFRMIISFTPNSSRHFKLITKLDFLPHSPPSAAFTS